MAAKLFEHNIILDSTFKSSNSNTSRGLYAFQMSPFKESQGELIGTTRELVGIKKLRVAPFYMPKPNLLAYTTNSGTNQGLPILVANGSGLSTDKITGPRTQLPFQKVTMGIRELSSHAFLGHKGRHHFEFEVSDTNNSDVMKLTPCDDFEECILPSPASFHTMTLEFKNPYNNIVFPNDVITNAIPKTNDSIRLKFCVSDHGLAIGDRILITGFNSTSDVINNYVNREDGHIVGDNEDTSGAIDPDEFHLNPSVCVTSLFSPANQNPNNIIPTTGSQLKITVIKNIVRIPMKAYTDSEAMEY